MSGSGDEDASRVKEVGWRQGSILSPDHVASLQAEGLLPSTYDSNTDLFIVLSHDCDVTNASFSDEPFVELLMATALPDKGVGNFYYGKNPRNYHFFLESGPEVYYECLIYSRLSIDRRVLLNHNPYATKVLDKHLLTRIRGWIARRYVREAFPDSFNKRIREAKTFVEKKQKEKSQLIVGVYLLLTEEELNDDEAYEIAITATMLDDDYSDPAKRKQANDYLLGLVGAFDEHPGIRVGDANVVSEDDLTVGELRDFKRWDTDSLSLRLTPPL